MSSTDEIRDRIKKLLRDKNLTSAGFADIIGVQRSGISHILSGRNKPSLDVLNKILLSFPDISGDWLITGKGDMYKKEITGTTVKDKELFPDEPDTGGVKAEEQPPGININREEEPPVYGKKRDSSVKKVEATTRQADTSGSEKIREVEKIVIFYSDHTFTEYKPE
ncbi:MAG: helix-turn-helix transcriptional regulator [Chlorobi bacterium]|nr:helix-turn-helix transcriptional regulator [Chlorobiota bacterium]